MAKSLYEILSDAGNCPPSVVASNRIDGPGSSLDLREFQQAMWRLPKTPREYDDRGPMEWTRGLPRTVGITINTGTKVEALPAKDGLIGVSSVDYGTEVTGRPGEIHPSKENWLLKVVELFDLSGVKFKLHNLRPGTQSSGLGGSATATTAVCLLANRLAGSPFNPTQIISLASRIEQDLGVSITGTQEQANVLFGGARDYIWFPWGIPGSDETGYGSSLHPEIVLPDRYGELSSRMAVFHTGRTRASTDVNEVWTKALSTHEGYSLHRRKLDIAYDFREGLRLSDWDIVLSSIREYREVRTKLCPDYMIGTHEILGFATDKGCEAFPLGAGGGGGVLIFAPEPEALIDLRALLSTVYREIPYEIKERGHEFANLPE